MSGAATVLLALAVPALAAWLAAHAGWARRIGVIVLCYAAGIVAGLTGCLPAATLALRSRLAEVAVLLALPLILLTVDLRAWTRLAPRALAAMGLAVAAVTTVATAGFLVLRSTGVPRAHEFAGLAVGVYTGGTPNLAAIQLALGVDEARYLMFNAVDAAVTVAYLAFMVALGARVFAALLPAPHPQAGVAGAAAPAGPVGEPDLGRLLTRRGAAEAAAGLGVAAAILGVSLWIAHRAGSGPSPGLIVALVTTLGLAASLSPRVRRLEAAYPAGMYLIYVFSFAVSSMASLPLLAGSGLVVPAFVAAVVGGSVLLHALLCRILRIDLDTFLVTSVSAICSPAFVPLMASVVRDPAVLLSGIVTGIIGYAIGTYLGIGVALLLVSLP